jgi:hypothetical protein
VITPGQLSAAIGVEQAEGVLQLRDGGVAAEAGPQLWGSVKRKVNWVVKGWVEGGKLGSGCKGLD